jgi:hypothetical protein
MTVPFIRFAMNAFETARNRDMPVPEKKNATTMTGNGGAHVSVVNPTVMHEHASMSRRDRPSLASSVEMTGAEDMNPKALAMKSRDTIEYET